MFLPSKVSPRFLCRPTAFFSTCWNRGTSESSTYGKQQTHFHVSWLSDFIFYPKPLYKSLHQSFFYSFITILPSESGVTRFSLRPYDFVISHPFWNICHVTSRKLRLPQCIMGDDLHINKQNKYFYCQS